MKTKLPLILALITQITFAQQVTLMQPALRDSDKVLVRAETFSTINGYDNEFFSGYTNYTSYDVEKNPISSNSEYFDENGNINNITNTSFEYYPIDEVSTVPYNYFLFPFKSYESKILNTNTSELLDSDYSLLIKDGRFSFYWEDLESYSYDYDENFNLIGGNKNEVTMQGDYPFEKLFYAFNDSTNEFEPDYKEIYYNTFDNGVLAERITKRITNFNTNTEENYSKETFIFTTDTFGHHLLDWNSTTNTWDISRKKITTYNSNNQPLNINFWLWDNTNGWNLVDNYTYSYNSLDLLETMSLSDGYITFNLTYNSDNLLTEYQYQSNGNTTETQWSVRNVFIYEPETASTNETNTSIINIYPNPTTKILNIDLEENFEYQIYSIQGKLLKDGVTNKQILVSDLEKGIYFIHIKTANLEEKQKFVVN